MIVAFLFWIATSSQVLYPKSNNVIIYLTVIVTFPFWIATSTLIVAFPFGLLLLQYIGFERVFYYQYSAAYYYISFIIDKQT